jgi:hypothetical protein
MIKISQYFYYQKVGEFNPNPLLVVMEVPRIEVSCQEMLAGIEATTFFSSGL